MTSQQSKAVHSAVERQTQTQTKPYLLFHVEKTPQRDSQHLEKKKLELLLLFTWVSSLDCRVWVYILTVDSGSQFGFWFLVFLFSMSVCFWFWFCFWGTIVAVFSFSLFYKRKKKKKIQELTDCLWHTLHIVLSVPTIHNSQFNTIDNWQCMQ